MQDILLAGLVLAHAALQLVAGHLVAGAVQLHHRVEQLQQRQRPHAADEDPAAGALSGTSFSSTWTQ